MKSPRNEVHLHYQFALDEKVALGGKIWASPMQAMRSGKYKLIGGLPKEVAGQDVEQPFMWYRNREININSNAVGVRYCLRCRYGRCAAI